MSPSTPRAAACLVFAAIVLLPLALLGPAGVAAADDASAPTDEVSARVLEASAIRMKALVEEARLLEETGRRDEAVAVLRAVSTVYEDAMRVVRARASVPAAGSRAAPPTPVATSRTQAPRPDVALRPLASTVPVAPSVPPETAKPLSHPASDPVGPAVDFLLARQSDDGLFRTADGRVDDDEKPARPDADADLATTGLVVLALADVVGAVPARDERALERREVAAIRAAADALAKAVGAEGELSRDPADHAYAAWGLATAYSRLGEPSWEAPLRRAVAHTLDSQSADGSWRDVDPEADLDAAPDASVEGSSLLVAVAQCGFLHEVLPTSAGEPSERIRSALERASRRVARSGVAADVPPAARAAGALVGALRGPRSAAPDATWAQDAAARSADPRYVLWGTLLLQATLDFEGDRAGRAWWNGVLVPAVDRQRTRVGPARGSWDPPRGFPGGRLAATATLLLAWKVPTTPWIAPVAGKGM